tara:strand:+ start:389 stop:934 length:546 start_codon:yes stop_codon:yes gene_type:complete
MKDITNDELNKIIGIVNDHAWNMDNFQDQLQVWCEELEDSSQPSPQQLKTAHDLLHGQAQTFKRIFMDSIDDLNIQINNQEKELSHEYDNLNDSLDHAVRESRKLSERWDFGNLIDPIDNALRASNHLRSSAKKLLDLTNQKEQLINKFNQRALGLDLPVREVSQVVSMMMKMKGKQNEMV